MMAKQQSYEYFPNELSPILLDIYDSRGKLDTMGAIFRTRIIFVMYKPIKT